MNVIYIALNKNIDCQYLCNKIGKMLNYYISNNVDLSNKILHIEIKEPVDQKPIVHNIEYQSVNSV